MPDFYPTSMDARSAWHTNWAKHLGSFKTKYNLTTAMVDQASADADWMTFWVGQRHDFDARSQQLTKYFNTIAGKDETAEAPIPIDWPAAPGVLPGEVAPGIEARVRAVARHIKGHSSYAPADGELLGIVSPTSEADSPEELDDLTPTFDLVTQAEFKLKADFRKKGMDGIRFEYRHAGGAWNAAGILLNSGGRFTVPPSEAGKAEQVEVRGIYIRGNEDIGTFSPAVSAFVAP